MSPAPAAAVAAKAAASESAQAKARQEQHSSGETTTTLEETETTDTYSYADRKLPGSSKDHQIILLLVLAGVVIFIQHDRAGKPQEGVQFAALGVVGFVLLVIANFAPDIAFMFTILFVVAVVLNSPKGIPLVSSAATSAGTGGASSLAGGSSSLASQGGAPSMDPNTVVTPKLYTGRINPQTGLPVGTSVAGGGTGAIR